MFNGKKNKSIQQLKAGWVWAAQQGDAHMEFEPYAEVSALVFKRIETNILRGSLAFTPYLRF